MQNITNIDVFTSSIGEWIGNISVNSVIIMIMMIFMIVGAVDKIRGNKLGYGEQFEEGFNAMGPLAMAMAGVVAAAPVLAIILKPILVPVYNLVGADSSMFATTLLACDMGGYPLAMNMAANETIGNFSGLILGTMMGPTIVFTIPVAL
ncbi:MAG: ethanolamine utilization protein EutH, partial [Eubacterium sp.]